MNLRRIASQGLAAALVIFSTATMAQNLDIAVVHVGVDDSGPFGISNATAYLAGDSRFATVGNIDVDGDGVPTVGELSAYSAILVVTDNRAGTLTGGGLGTDLGNVLDDYVLGGGRVVFSTFSGNTGIGVDGDILALSPHVPNGGNATAGTLNMGSVVAHPVFDGVTSFESSYASDITVSASGTTLASYDSGTLGVLTTADDSIIFVNGYPAAEDDYSNGSDFGLVFANALALTAFEPTPVPALSPVGLLLLVLLFAAMSVVMARRRRAGA